MAGRLPKVTEYILNIGKSVGYATVDTIKEPTENISNFVETNNDLFKEVYASIVDYRGTFRRAGAAIKKSKVYDAAVSGFKNMKEDLATGKFYNKERAEKYGAYALGFSEEDIDDLYGDGSGKDDYGFSDDDFNFDEDEDYDEEASSSKSSKPSKEAITTVRTAAGLGDVMIATSNSQSNVLLGAAENITEVNKANAKLAYVQGERLFSSMVQGFTGINGGIDNITKILNGPMVTYMNESTKFYGDVSSKLNEITAYLKESTEMSRNLYKQQQTEYKESKYDEVGGGGAPDIKAYAKVVYKNLLALDPTGGYLTGTGDENIFKTFAGSPLQFIPALMSKVILPKRFTDRLKKFDENMEGMFSTYLARMSQWKTMDNAEGGISIRKILGTLLGVKFDEKKKIDPSKYPKGPMPFDGQTKKAIVDVIPAYLARIEAALTGAPERAFDHKTGTFRTIRDIHKEYKSQAMQGNLEAVYPFKDDYDKWADSYMKSLIDTEGETAALRWRKEADKKLLKIGKVIYKRNGDFNPYRGNGPKGDRDMETNEYTDILPEWMKFMEYLTKNNRKAFYEVADSVIQHKQRQAAAVRETETGFGTALGVLADGRLQYVDSKGVVRAFNPDKEAYTTTNGKGDKLYAPSPVFKSGIDYLKDILAETRTIRISLTGNKPAKGASASPSVQPTLIYDSRGNPIITSTATGQEKAPTFEEIQKQIIEESKTHDEEEREKDYKQLVKEREEEKKKKEEEGKTEGQKLWDEQLGKYVDEKTHYKSSLQKAQDAADSILKAPIDFALKVIEKADQRIFEMVFGRPDGKTLYDRAGRSYKGLLDYMINRTSEAFDDLKRKISSKWEDFKDWFFSTTFGEKVNQIKDKLMEKLTGKVSSAGNRVKEAVNNTYGRAYRYGKGIVEEDHIEKNMGIGGEYTLSDAPIVQDLSKKDISLGTNGIWRYHKVPEMHVDPINPKTGKPYSEKTMEKRRALAKEEARRWYDEAEKTESTPTVLDLNLGDLRKSDDTFTNLANGGVVKKYQMAMLSPGEMVIPNPDEKTRKENLKQENKTKNKILDVLNNRDLRASDIGNYAEGTVNNKGNKDKNSEQAKTESAIRKVMREVDGEGADIAANALIGSGVSLITGMFGGPLLGAAAGAGIGLVKNSTYLQKVMFGEQAENGDYKGGVIPANITNAIKKHSQGMIDFGIAGGIAGLFTPGLVGGMLAGSTLGYVKDTEWFKEAMFGNEKKGKKGLIPKDIREKLKKAYPNMGVGTIAGIVAGPFGLVGNAVVGASIGYLSSTELFKDKILGKKDKDGKRKGGLVGAFKAGLVDPIIARGKEIANGLKNYVQEAIIGPTKTFVKGFGGWMKDSLLGIGDRIVSGLNGIFKDHIGVPLEEFLREKVFKRINSALTTILKYPVKLIGGALALPFTAIGGIGNTFMANRIARGAASGTAQERLDYRKRHKARFALRNDRAIKADRQLANMGSDQLSQIMSGLDEFIDNRGKKRLQYNDMMDDAGDIVSKYFDEKNLWNTYGHGIHPLGKVFGSKDNAYNNKREIMKLIQAGNIRGAEGYMRQHGFNDEMISDLWGRLDIGKLQKAKVAKDIETKNASDLISRLEKETGLQLRDPKSQARLRNYRKMVKNEYESRKAQEEQGLLEKPEIDPNVQIKDNTSKMLDVLISINNQMGGFGNKYAFDENGIRIPTKEEQAKAKKKEKEAEKNKDNPDYKPEEEPTTHDDDSLATRMARKAKAMKDNALLKMSNGITGIAKALGVVDDKGDENKVKQGNGIADKIVNTAKFAGNTAKGIGGGLLKVLGFGGTILGKVLPLVLGASMLGWGSQLFKTTIAPWFKEHVAPFFQGLIDKIADTKFGQKITGLINGIQDGTLMSALVGKVAQGLNYALKNVIGPATEAIITNFPSIVGGIVTGVAAGFKNLITGKGSEYYTNYGSSLKFMNSSFNTGKDEAEISKNFNGTNYKYSKTVKYSNPVSSTGNTISESTYKSTNKSVADATGDINLTYDETAKAGYLTDVPTYDSDGTYQNDNGSTSVVNGDDVTVYDKKGNYVATYDQSDGKIKNGNVDTKTGLSGLAHIGTQTFLRSLATGTRSIPAKIANAVATKITGKNILKNYGKAATGSLAGTAVGSVEAATKATGSLVSGANNLGVTLNNTLLNGGTKAAETVAEEGTKEASRIFTVINGGLSDAAETIGSSAVNNATNTATNAANTTFQVIEGGASSAVDTVVNAAGGAATGSSNSIISAVTKKFAEFAVKFTNSKVFTYICRFARIFLGPINEGVLKGLFEKLLAEIPKRLGSGLLARCANSLLAIVGRANILSILLWIKAFYDGAYGKTETMLEVSKDSGLVINGGVRFIMGVYNMIQQNLFYGLGFSAGTIIKIIVDVLGDFCGISKDALEAAQEKTKNILEAAGIQAGEEVSLAEYNNQEGWITKGFKAIKKFLFGKGRTETVENTTYEASDDEFSAYANNNTTVGSTTNIINNGASGAGRKNGKARGGAQGGIYSSMPYGNSTIGESGCGPIAAASAMNGSIPDAALYAQKTGHVNNDGTDIGFFGDYFAGKGINSSTTTSKSAVSKAIDNGQSTVLLGRDPGGGIDSAYSNANHYITAQGKDKNGNVIIDDPELGRRSMPKDKVLKNMQASVITGKARYSGGTSDEEKAKAANTLSSLSAMPMHNTLNSKTDFDALSKVANSGIDMTPTTNADGTKSYTEEQKAAQKETANALSGKTTKQTTIYDYTTKAAQNVLSNKANSTKTTSDKLNEVINSNNGTEEANIAKVIAIAENEVGYIESSNNGTKYGEEYGMNNNAWCAMFVWWVFKHAGGESLYYGGKKTAYCPTLYKYYKSNGQLVSSPKAGDIIFFSYNGGSSCNHVGLVVSDPDSSGKFYTVEGNAGSKSDRVVKNSYKTTSSSILGYARPAYNGVVFGDIDISTSDSNGESTSSPTLFDKITQIGKLMMKGIYGENTYNALFGEDTDSADTSDSTSDTSSSSGSYNGPTADQIKGDTNAAKAWNYLRNKGYTEEGAAAVLGNLYHESGIRPNAVEGYGTEKSKEYTNAVNNGTKSKSTFSNDSKGYGLAQWTYKTRKSGLYDYLKGSNLSIDDIGGQLGYLDKELAGYSKAKNVKTSTNLEQANEDFVLDFERPNQKYSNSWPSTRLKTAKAYYNQFKGTSRDDVYSGSARSYLNDTSNVTDNNSIATTTSAKNVTVKNESNSNDYSSFMKTIISILLSISDNTEVLNKVLEVLQQSTTSTGTASEDTQSTKKKLQQSLNKLMNSSENAKDTADILQSKDTNWLVQTMAAIAQE
jgi:cell wall-associated NlpC family hydrolase